MFCIRALALAVAAGLLFASCSSNSDQEEPPPTTVRFAADRFLDEESRPLLVQLASSRNLTVEDFAAEQADLIVSSEESPGAVPYVIDYWVPVVANSSEIESVSMEELESAMFRQLARLPGGPDNLEDLQGIVPGEGGVGFLKQWWPNRNQQGGEVRAMPLADIYSLLEDHAASIALLPLELVGPSMRAVSVDGVNIVFGEGDIASYPLVERAWVDVAPHENDEFSKTLGELAQQLAARLSAPPPDPIILRATGDVIPARCVYEKHLQYNDFAHAFRLLAPWLADADITVSSLDAAASDAGTPFGCQETFSLLAPAASVEGFALAGIDVITVATNHAKDCGTSSCGDQSLLETLENLRARDVQPVGGGTDLAQARRPAFEEMKGTTFAFLGYDQIASYYHASADAPGTAPLNEAYLREDVAAAAQQADVVVVMPHWGVEYTADPNDNQRTLARVAVVAGADLVIGNHPHWVQAAEAIDGSFVAYALGNFVFDQDWSIETQQGAMLEAAFHGPRLAGIRYIPVRIVDNHQPRFADPDEANQILDRIWDASDALD